MVKPTNPEPRRFVPRTGRDVWSLPGPPGYLESIQAAGSVAAPLLAAASFTLAALVLQSTTPFGRWQDLALLLFVGAGLAQVFAVQSVIWTRRYIATPDEFRQWFPEDFTDRGEHPTPWLLNVQGSNNMAARKWADRTRMWINAGISLLLAGIAVGVVPPGHISAMRWAVITAAWIGVAVEGSWVTAAVLDESARLGMLLNSAAVFTSGGATAAAGFAATAGSPNGAPATWWATALSVVAVPFWLAACTGARFSHGRVRLDSRFEALTIVQASLAVLAPVVFILALWSAAGRLAEGRRGVLCGMHPGIEKLLPRSVSLGVHHRAWSRSAAVLVAQEEELGELLRDPAQCPGQPCLAEMWKRLVHSPGCVVKVVDRDDVKTRWGYFIVYPLLGETVRRIRSGHITADRQFEPADLAGSPDAAVGWYISAIWAPGRKWTRRCVIASLVDALAVSRAGSAARPVFALPATEPGRSLMKGYGFAALGAQPDGIWVLQD